MLNNTTVRSYIRDQAPNLSPYSDLGRGSLTYQMGTRLPELAKPGMLRPVGNWLSDAGVDSGSFAAGGAVAGGLAGAGLGIARHTNHPLESAAKGALLGAGGSFLLSELMKSLNTGSAGVKRSFYAGNTQSDPYQYIARALNSDNSYNMMEKQQLLPMVSRLAPQQMQELSGLLRGATAGGAIYLIARYLLNLGVGGSLVLSILGGSVFGNSSTRNAYGQRTDTKHDVFGNSRVVF